MSCKAFTDFLSRKSEHLDDRIIRALHPIGTWVGHVNIGRFEAEDGVEHTFDRFENVFPDLRGVWEDVQAASCVGKPCDPDETLIGMGFTRDSYKLQRKAYGTDLFCFDQILSADRAKRQFAHIIRTLKRATSLINSHRLKTEAFRIAKYKWACADNTLVPITAVWNSTMTQLTVSKLPTSKITARHLQRRVEPQIMEGALGEELNTGTQPMLETVMNMDTCWDIVEGNPELTDHWRYQQWENASEYYKYGWTGKIGNYGMRADWMPLRFDVVQQNADGTWLLNLVLPYSNVSATEGIKEAVNQSFLDAPVQINYIWNRMAMISRVRDTTQINPEMPYAARDFAGKWRWAMNNLTCGTDPNGNPIAVNNEWGNKGKFISMFSYATQAEYPEFAEGFICLREPACIVDVPRCASTPAYTTQNFSSANATCSDTNVTLTFTPNLENTSQTYLIQSNSILCNGILIVHDQIQESTLAALVATMNVKLSAMGTWAVAGSNITLTGPACTDVNIPWTV